MATVSTPILAPITGSTTAGNSIIKVTYTVTFDDTDLSIHQPYDVRANLIGDDTNASGDLPGGVDDHLWVNALGVIHPTSTPQTLTKTFEVPNSVLNEDNPSEPAPVNPNPDEIRALITVTPKLAKAFTSHESNLQTVSF